ncbi:hypothetical protein F66182_8187 [Fusarium sp. NRRL 66182]|nr:hypothetical protein F66182_8187 [Fusarium sp. NRRL 66182]
MLTIPKLTLLAALVIGSCVTCTDPILSQAIAKGPFADKYVARPLREIISAEASANDGFGFPFLMLATYLIQHAEIPGAGAGAAAKAEAAGEAGHSVAHALMARAGQVGRLGGGVGVALTEWFVETWLYTIVLSIAYGAVVGYGSCKAVRLALRWKWIDNESYVLFPTALGLFIVGTTGTGITWGRLLGLGLLVRAMGPTVYWLVLFSIIVHGLSIPALNVFYHYTGKAPIKDDAVELRRISMQAATPANVVAGDKDTFIAYNRFSRHIDANAVGLPVSRSANKDRELSHDEDFAKGRQATRFA